MTHRPILTGLLAAALGLAALSGHAQDATSDNQVNTETDWSIFVETDPNECWAVSPPKETVNTRDGRIVSVRRGDILLFVTFRPGANAVGEVSFTGGYPFADGSTVDVKIGDDTFQFMTNGEWAWPGSAEEDGRVVDAMKRGIDAVLTARSSRGTQTQDTFSLLGFTAALEDAERRCRS